MKTVLFHGVISSPKAFNLGHNGNSISATEGEATNARGLSIEWIDTPAFWEKFIHWKF